MNGETDLTRSIEHDWAEFRGRLASYIEVMDDGDILTLDAKVGHEPDGGCAPWLQVLRCDDQVCSVAVGNDYLAPAHQLDADAVSRLLGWGFGAPGDPIDFPLMPEGCDSFHEVSEAGEVVPALAMAARMVDALRNVYGVLHPALLEVTGPDHDRGALDLVAPPPREGQPPPPVLVPERAEQLRDLIGQAFSHLEGSDVEPDADGDFGVVIAGSPFWVGASHLAPVIQIDGCVLVDVVDRSAAKRTVRKLNRKAPIGRLYLSGQQVRMAASVPAIPFMASQMHGTLSLMEQFLERALPKLLKRAGGRHYVLS